MKHKPADYGWLLVGAVIISIGSGLAGVYSFRGQFVIVSLGFVLFFIGFQLSQFGVHQWPERGVTDIFDINTNQLEKKELITRGTAVAVGPLLIGGGVTLFSQTIIDPTITYAILAGVVSVIGYVVSHYGLMGRMF